MFLNMINNNCAYLLHIHKSLQDFETEAISVSFYCVIFREIQTFDNIDYQGL